MKVRFWGTRGSIPAPLTPKQIEDKICQAILALPDIDTHDPETVQAHVRQLPPLWRGTAGGNTACVEIQAGGETFIIDAGSGLRELSHELMKGPCSHGQGVLHLFISHLHWDHIQGFPFFTPALIPGNQIFIYGIHDVQAALEKQQSPPNWPISLSFMRATLEFISLQVGQALSIGPVRIDTIQNTHPNDSYSYRFQDQYSTLVYASDVEFKELDKVALRPFIDFVRRADALIFDAQYTLKEVWQKQDWGHSSAMIGVDLARAAGVKRLLLFHHDPGCSDADLESVQSTTIAYQEQDTSRPTCEVIVAREGLILDLTPPDAVDLQLTPTGETAIVTPIRIFDEHGVDQLAQGLARLAAPSSSSIIDLSQVENLSTASLKALVSLRQERKGAPIVLAAPSDNVRQVIALAGYQDYFAIYPSVQAALAAVQAREALNLSGQIIRDRYQIQETIGEGQLGTVLKATDTSTNRQVALKILTPAFSQETIDYFMRQSQQIMALDHPSIVKVFAWDKYESLSFKVEEFVTESTLEEILVTRSTPLPGDQAMSIASDVARALEYVHSRGIIHADLKPANIFLTDAGIKLSGLGLGRLEEGRDLLKAPLLFLTAEYLAPEQILGQPLDARTDLYALGVILYQLFTGRLPFEGIDREIMLAHLHQAPQLPRELNPHLSPSLEHLILKLLAKNPNDRYASAQQTWRISSSLIAHTDEAISRYRVPLIGRQQPLQSLYAAWQEARAGRGKLVFISGEPGIGKTSLAQQAAAQSGAPVLLVGQCQAPQGSPAYHLFTQVLQSYFSTVPPEFFDDRTYQQIANFSRLIPEIRQMLPDLSAPSPLEPGQEQLRLMTSLTQFIKRATQERPWLLILDDLQWADPMSLGLLRYLGRHLPSMAMLVIGNYRDTELERGHPLLETLHDLSRHPTYYHLHLDRLDLAQVGQLLGHLWEQPAPEALVARIYQHTQGNPFYVEEVAKGLVDEGLISFRGGQWVFPSPEEIHLPPSVRESVWQRIGHLSPETQTLLRQAAVLGQTFRFDDLQQMSGLPEWQTLEHLDMALERQLVQEVPGDFVLRFRHPEIQHVLYEDLGPLRRRMLHRQAGEALERRARAQPELIAEQLAYHFDKAGEPDKTLVYSLKAARQAQATYANEAARLWYQRTLDRLAQLDPGQAVAFQWLRLEAHHSLGEVLSLVGEYGEALKQYAAARRLLEDEILSPAQARQMAHLCRQTAQAHEKRSEYGLALEWLDKGLSYLDEGEPTPEQIHIYNLAGWTYVRKGEYGAAQTQLEQALTLARFTGLRQLEADSLHGLGAISWFLGSLAQTITYGEQALHIFRELDDRQGEPRVLNLLAAAFQSQGDYGKARSYYGQSLSIYREIGSRQGEGVLLDNLGIIFTALHCYTQARAYHEQALHIRTEIGDRWGTSQTLLNLGVVHERLGDYAQAQAHYEQALDICQQIGYRRGESQTLTEMGLLHHHRGDDHLAYKCCQQALSIIDELNIPSAQADALTNLGHALAGLGRLDAAQQAYQQALDIRYQMNQLHLMLDCMAGLARIYLAQEDAGPTQALTQVERILNHLETHSLDGTIEPLRVYLTCYHVLQANQDLRAQAILDTARALLEEQTAQVGDEALRRSFLENVAAHRDIQQSPSQPSLS